MYEFICKNCGDPTEHFLTIEKRNGPITEDCAKCGENAITKRVSEYLTGYDFNLKCGQDFKTLVERIKHGGTVPKRFHEKLDNAANRHGGHFGHSSRRGR